MPEPIYDESTIKSLDWKEHIRTRPGMYIGKLGDGSSHDDGIYILLKEVMDNGIDEFIMGHGKTIELRAVKANLSRYVGRICRRNPTVIAELPALGIAHPCWCDLSLMCWPLFCIVLGAICDCVANRPGHPGNHDTHKKPGDLTRPQRTRLKPEKNPNCQN